MSHHGNAAPIYHAETHTLIKRGLRAGDELFAVGVIWFGLAFTNDRDSGILEDRITRRNEGHRRAPIQKRKLIRRATDLPCGSLGFVLRGIRFHQSGKRAILWVVTWRQIEIGAELDAVRAFVFQNLLLGKTSRSIRIGKKCDLLPSVFGKIA